MQPIIGIVSRCDYLKDRSIIYAYDKYRRAILKSGGIPILVLPTQVIDFAEVMPRDSGLLEEQEQNMLEKQLQLCQGIVVPGGTRAYDYDRYIIKYANDHKIPLLGICMGMQIMCNYKNGNKNVINEDDRHKKIEEDFVHKVTIHPSSKLYQIVGETTFMVSSNHSYHVLNSGDYITTGYSEDELIEAIEKEGAFNIGVQWHPEKTYDKDIVSKRLFDAFINASKSKMVS